MDARPDNFKIAQKKLEATEMWFWWRMLRISWTSKKSNEIVLPEYDTRSLIKQSNFFGHLIRKRN